MQEYIVIEANEGRIVEKKNVQDEPGRIVKEYAEKALKQWDPLSSDFTVIRSKIEIAYDLPMDPDTFDRIEQLGLERAREERKLIVTIPVYTISYDNKWEGNYYQDKKIIVIAPYIDDNEVEQIKQYAVEATSGPTQLTEDYEIQLSEDAIERLEEGLKEIEEEEEKPRKKRRRRTSRKKKA